MKIAHLILYYAPKYKGGVQRYVEALVPLQRTSMDVQILTTDAFYNGEIEKGVIRVPYHGVFFRTPLAPKLLQAIKQLDVDLVHIHSPNPLIDLTALKSPVPFVVSVHNCFPKNTLFTAPLLYAAKSAFSRCLKKAKCIIAYDKEFLPTILPSQNWEEKTCIVPPGIDRSFYKPGRKKRGKEILFVAHIRPEKGLHVLMEAMKYLPTDTQLIIAGKTTYFERYVSKEKKKAKALGKRVRFHMNPSKEELLHYYQTCGVVVCPSIGLESFNFVQLEAAACGAPVVRSDLPAMSWLKSGLEARVGDAKDLAEKITLALQTKGLGLKCHKESKKYSWRKTAKLLEKVYKGALQ